MEFSVTSKVENEKIVCEIHAPEANEFTRYACYLYDEKGKILEKQGYTKESSKIFCPAATGIYWVKGFIQYRESPESDQKRFAKRSDPVEFVSEKDQSTNISQAMNTVQSYRKKILSYETIEDETFWSTEPIVYEIHWNGVKFEILINNCPKSQKAVVIGTGALDKPRSEWPFFSRHTWRTQFNCNAIYYFDPTVYDVDINLAWGYGTHDRWYLKDISALLDIILRKLSITRDDTLFFGSSGGGYMSIVLATLLKGKATAINPQIFLLNYRDDHIRRMRELLWQDENLIQKERIDMLALFQREGYMPEVHLIENSLAPEDINRQVAPLLVGFANAGIDFADRFRLDFYSAVGGHGVMPPKADCLRVIQQDLARPLKPIPQPAADESRMPAEAALPKRQDSGKCVLSEEKIEELIPNPRMNYKKEQLACVADDIISGKMQVFHRLQGMPYDVKNIDWTMQPKKMGNTFQLYLQGLQPVAILVCAYEQSLDYAYLEFAKTLVRSWRSFAEDKERAGNSKYIWNDHAVAMRTETLIFLRKVMRQACKQEDSLLTELQNMLNRHGEHLYNDENYTKRHNHGIMQDQALLYLGYLTHRQEWISHAKERLKAQLEWAFNPEMVHTENSPGYAKLVIGIINKIAQFLISCKDPFGDELCENMDRAQAYLDWATLPNGFAAQIGDTQSVHDMLYTTESSSPRKQAERHKIYPGAGIYFYRSDRDELTRNDTWKTLKCGFVQTTHKHADDGSFMLYSKGYEVFVDGGLYGYTSDPFREYFKSAKAHNMVVVDNGSYPCDMDHKELIGVSGYRFISDYDHIRIYNNAYEGVSWERDFCSADDLTILVDSVASFAKHTYSQVFHLAEHIEVLKADDCEVVLKLADSGFVVRLRQHGDPARLTVIRGDKNVPGYGLISRGTNHLDTITTLKFDLVTNCGVFATAIAIEDQEGYVRLGDKKEKSVQLLYSKDEKTFTLGDLTIACRKKFAR